MTVSLASSMELPLLVLLHYFLHVHELVLLIVSQHDDLGVRIDFDSLLRREVH